MGEAIKPNWVEFGRKLRDLRERQGMSCRELGRQAACAESLVSKLERGTRRAKPEVVAQLGRALGAADELEQARDRAARADCFGWLADLAELEAEAVSIKMWAPLLVPGLLQTPAYAQAIFEHGRPGDSPETINSLVSSRMARSELALAGKELWTILDETALYRCIQSPQVMADQLDHLLELTSSRSRCKVMVLPAGCCYTGGLSGPLTVLLLRDQRRVAYAEHAAGGEIIADPEETHRLESVWREITAWASCPTQSRQAIERAREAMRERAG